MGDVQGDQNVSMIQTVADRFLTALTAETIRIDLSGKGKWNTQR